MNLGAMVAAIYAKMPSALQGPVVFTDAAGETTTAVRCVGLPAKPLPTDDMNAFTATTNRGRTLVVLPTGLTFAPRAGLLATWEGTKWNVIAVSALNPAGAEITTGNVQAAALFRVTVTR